MKKKYGSRMLAKARGKYGKPNYLGRKDKTMDKKEVVKKDVNVVYGKEQDNNIDENACEIWEAMKKAIYEDISPVSYETWIEPCKPLMIADGRIVLMVENAFFKEMLKKRYVNFLQEAAEKVMNQNPVKIEVITMQK